jgi:hypothetical protein
MNSKPKLRLLTLLISTALLAALTVGAPAAPAAAKKCPKGKTAWEVEGGSVCVGGRLGSAADPRGAAMFEKWLLDAARPLPGGSLRLTPALRRAVPRAGQALARAVAGIGGGAGASSAAPARGPVIERHSKLVGWEDLGHGVTVEGRIRARVYEDYSHEVDVDLELWDQKGNALIVQPNFKGMSMGDDEVECPTAAGLVSLEMRGEMGGTAIRKKNDRVLGSKTESHSWRVAVRGQVGTDARLQSVAADMTMKAKTFERGLQLQTTIDASVSLSRQGAATISGTPSVGVSIRAAGLSRAEEREAEAELARGVAGTPEIATIIGDIGSIARKQLLEAEPTWYELPNQCAQLTWTPGPGVDVQPDETRGVTGAVIARRDGGRASGSIAVTAVDLGRLIPITKAFSPDGPASFIAAGGKPDASGRTVIASAIATSTAGRAQASWFANGTPVEPPRSFTGTIASTSSAPGLTRSFTGSATYTRTSVMRGPDGSINAWYELTSAPLAEAKETLGPTQGCRYEGVGTAGQIESGDLELRILPTGEVVYALLYDQKVPAPFAPTDCPQDQPALDIDEISVFLNTRRPGPEESQLRPAGHGYQLIAEGVQDVTTLPGTTTTASWNLMPG